MARRILNRKELRAASDAAERRAEDEEEEQDEEEEEEEASAEKEESEGEEDEEEAEAPKKAKAKPKPPKKPAKRKSRAAKVTRMRVVWGVFNNSNQRVATYDYPRRADAEAHAAKLTSDKKTTHFIQPVKEPLEEKKEK